MTYILAIVMQVFTPHASMSKEEKKIDWSKLEQGQEEGKRAGKRTRLEGVRIEQRVASRFIRFLAASDATRAMVGWLTLDDLLRLRATSGGARPVIDQFIRLHLQFVYQPYDETEGGARY